jgi:hypothetical protein
MVCGQEMTYSRSILEDLWLAGEARMVFPEAAVEAEVGELGVLNTIQLRERGKALGVVPVGDGRTAKAWRLGSRAARGAAQQAVAVAAPAEVHTLAGAAAAATELVRRGGGWRQNVYTRQLKSGEPIVLIDLGREEVTHASSTGLKALPNGHLLTA